MSLRPGPDIEPEEFRRLGRALVDRIADFMSCVHAHRTRQA
jgi:hypothetical protein